MTVNYFTLGSFDVEFSNVFGNTIRLLAIYLFPTALIFHTRTVITFKSYL